MANAEEEHSPELSKEGAFNNSQIGTSPLLAARADESPEAEAISENERGADDGVSDLKSGSPQGASPQDFNPPDESKAVSGDGPEDESPQDFNPPDESKDMNVDGPEEESPQDFNPPEEVKDVNVDGREEELAEDDQGEKSLENEKFVAPFPISRVKRIAKLDKDVRLVTSDAVALVAEAAALFVQSLSSASFKIMLQSKRKTIRGPDVILAAKSTRQFRECLGNDLAALLEEPHEDTVNGEDEPVDGTTDEAVRTRPLHQKSAKKHQLAAPPGSRPITNFFKA